MADTITIDRDSVEWTSFACPTIFDMRDEDGNEYYFRLRNGYWRFANDIFTLASDTAPSGVDGVCDFDEALEMIRNAGVDIRLAD